MSTSRLWGRGQGGSSQQGGGSSQGGSSQQGGSSTPRSTLAKLCRAADAYRLLAQEASQVLAEITDQTSLEAALVLHAATTNPVLRVAAFECLPLVMVQQNLAPHEGARFVACAADELVRLMARIGSMTCLEQALELVEREAAKLTSQSTAAVLGVALDGLFHKFVPSQATVLIVKVLTGKHLTLTIPLPCTARHLVAHEQVKAEMRKANRVIYCGKLVGVVTRHMAQKSVHVVPFRLQKDLAV